MDAVPLLDRAYDRRAELLDDPAVSWVRMGMDTHGVTFTIGMKDGSKEVEFLPRDEVEITSPGACNL